MDKSIPPQAAPILDLIRVTETGRAAAVAARYRAGEAAAALVAKASLDMRPRAARLDGRDLSFRYAVVAGNGPIGAARVCANGGNIAGRDRLPPASAFVNRLFVPCRPAAVLGGLGTLVIPAIDAQSRRTLAHIRKKINEPVRTGPTLADTDAASSVVPLRVGVRAAAYKHALPDAVGAGHGTLARGAMLDIKSLLTAAARCQPMAQVDPANFALGATVAATQPIVVRSCASFAKLQHRPTPDAKSYDINESGHGDLPKRLPRQVAAGVSAPAAAHSNE